MSAAALTAAERSKLAAILGRLGSEHAGERDAAALAASRFVQAHSTTWPALLAGQNPSEVMAEFIVQRMHEGMARAARRDAVARALDEMLYEPELSASNVAERAARYVDAPAAKLRQIAGAMLNARFGVRRRARL